MKIIYQDKEIECQDKMNGFDLAKLVDNENKKEDIAVIINEKISDMRSELKSEPRRPLRF